MKRHLIRDSGWLLQLLLLVSIVTIGIDDFVRSEHSFKSSIILIVTGFSIILWLICYNRDTDTQDVEDVRIHPKQASFSNILFKIFRSQPTFLRHLMHDLCVSLSTRPYVGLGGLLALVISAIMCWKFATNDLNFGNFFGLALGVIGLVFSLLGYHVSLKVDNNIRSSINDFREFIVEGCDIIKEVMDENEKRKLPESKDGDPSIGVVVLLWFPFYRLTKDIEKPGGILGRKLEVLKANQIPSLIITAKDPLQQMHNFDAAYKDGSRNYKKDCFARLEAALRGVPVEEWSHSEGVLRGCDVDEVLVDCIHTLSSLHTSRASWVVRKIDNTELANGAVQLVWTPRRAAIVFMPLRLDVPASANRPFLCSGFSTRDPSMINMIRDLVEIRFEMKNAVSESSPLEKLSNSTRFEFECDSWARRHTSS